MGHIIIGTGSKLGKIKQTNQDIIEKYPDILDDFDTYAKKTGTSLNLDSFAEQKMGFKYRYIAAPGETTSDLCAQAAQKAIESAGIHKNQIGYIKVTTATPDKFSPHTSAIVQEKLGITNNCNCSDNLSACPGFIVGLREVAAQLTAYRNIKYALLISGDTMSTIKSRKRFSEAMTFGDGAGAVVIKNTNGDMSNYGIMASSANTNGLIGNHLNIAAGGSAMPIRVDNIDEILEKELWSLNVNNKEVKKWAIKFMIESSLNLLNDEQMPIHMIDYFLFHQAAGPFLDAAIKKLGVSPKIDLRNVHKYGNMSQASIPVLLDSHVRKGVFKNGDKLLMTAVGGGLAWASLIYNYFDYAQVPKNVIMVGDDTFHTDALQRLLKGLQSVDQTFKTDLNFHLTYSGDQFLQELGEKPGFYNIGLIDQELTDMYGLEVLEKSRSIEPNLLASLFEFKRFFPENPMEDIPMYLSAANYIKFKKMVQKSYLFE